MKIYKFIADSDEFNSFLVDAEYRNIKYSIGEGNSLINTWEPMPVKNFYKDDEGEFPATAGDFPSLTGAVPVLSQKAWDVLRPYLDTRAEALPIITKSGKYYALNVLDIVEGLDEEKSEISYNKVTGRVSRIYKYVFFPDKIKDKFMFKVPQTKGLEVYVSEQFKKVVEENNLKGLVFDKILFEY